MDMIEKIMTNKKMPAGAQAHTADTTNHLNGTAILEQCQMESYQKTKPDISTRRKEILKALDIFDMTAREIAYKLNYKDLNAVKPRLTEMVHAGMVEVVGKRFDEMTQRKVSVYRRLI